MLRAAHRLRRWVLLVSCVLGCKHATEEAPIGDGGVPAGCPTYLDLDLDGRNSRFDPGWTGTAHGVGLPQGSRTSVKIDQCDAECRRCTFHGPVRGTSDTVISQRCLHDVSLPPCETDEQCMSGGEDRGPCRFMFPPIAAPMAMTTACSLAYFEPPDGGDAPPVQGVIDLKTGESDLRVLNMLLKVGFDSCSTCDGDRTPSDGVADGRCGGGDKPCDVHGISSFGETSFDCPPGFSLSSTIALGSTGTSTSSVQWTMDPATRPLCTAPDHTTQHCWCGLCIDGTPCMSNKDCAPGTTCGAATPPPPNNGFRWEVANNQCMTGSTCIWDAATQTGRCSNTPTQPCYPDEGSIIATGFAEVHDEFYIAQLANLVCMRSFYDGTDFSAVVDRFAGFPGPFLFQARFRIIKRSGP
jgi:hypothetical protein